MASSAAERRAVDTAPCVGGPLGVGGTHRGARGFATPCPQEGGVTPRLRCRVIFEIGQLALDEHKDALVPQHEELALVPQRVLGIAPDAYETLEELAQLGRVAEGLRDAADELIYAAALRRMVRDMSTFLPVF